MRCTSEAETGRWTLTVRLWAPASEERWAMVVATPATPASAGACGTPFATIRGSTRPSAGAAFGSVGRVAAWRGPGHDLPRRDALDEPLTGTARLRRGVSGSFLAETHWRASAAEPVRIACAAASCG